MANIFEFDGFIPVIHPDAFVHPNATVTGNVIIGKDVYVGPGAAIRGDWGQIIIEDGCNVQENCTIHMFPGVVVLLLRAFWFWSVGWSNLRWVRKYWSRRLNCRRSPLDRRVRVVYQLS